MQMYLNLIANQHAEALGTLRQAYSKICGAQIQRVEETLLASGVLTFGKHLADFMQTNHLADPGESVLDVFLRATTFLAEAGEKFYGKEQIDHYQHLFLKHVANFEIILGSPILTNAGRRKLKSISACSIPPVKLSQMDREKITKIVGDYHTRGMGTGFCLNDVVHPGEMIKFLNHIAVSEVQRGEIERSVGNMGVLSIEHPKILEFIRVKTTHPEIREWKFNLSVNLTDKFMEAYHKQLPFMQTDGKLVNPRILMQQIAEDAHATGDPGLIFLDLINQLNRVPQMGDYHTVVPCGEVSLFDGEVCQFAYLNLARFIDEQAIFSDQSSDNASALCGIRIEGLRQAIYAAVILLDNAVESNINKMPNVQSAEIISNLRRIGVGICGFAETLQALGLSYSSPEGRKLAENIMSFINFESKRASVALAKDRGPFNYFHHPATRRHLFIEPFKEYPTDFVSRADWEELERSFSKYGIRNLSTTILPPTGRSSIIAGVTSSIEPPFRLMVDAAFKKALQRQAKIYGYQADLEKIYEHVRMTGSVQETHLPQPVKEIFRTALEISPDDHIYMTAAFQKYTDEGISKTINMPEGSSVEDIIHIYQMAYHLKLKGITIYRDGCRNYQPKALNIHSTNTETILDAIYGPARVSSRIAALLKSPLLTRLKGVHQNGTNFLIDPRQATSRYEHSKGAMILVQKLGGNEQQQVAALLHDISHTAFSHVVDLVYVNKAQNYHDLARSQFLQTAIARQAIHEFSISPAEMACEAFSIVKGKSLNVDRLDYCIRDLWKVNRIYHPQYSSILNNLVVDSDGEIKCKNLETARLLFKKFIKVNQEVYFQPIAEVASMVLSWILKQMLESGNLCEQDLFRDDESIMAKISCTAFKDTFEAINPDIHFWQTDQATPYPPMHRKLRYIDPMILGCEGKLTDHCLESRAMLNQYLATPTCVYYHIPILEKHYA